MISCYLCACHDFMSVESNGALCKFYQLFEAGKARDGCFVCRIHMSSLYGLLPEDSRSEDNFLYNIAADSTHP